MPRNYENMSDEQLIDLFKQGNNDVIDFLMEKYKFLVRYQAKDMFLPGADQEDLIQEGMIGLYHAIRDYNSEKEASFSTFAKICIARKMYTAIESAQRLKHSPLNHYVPLEQNPAKEETVEDPQNMILEKENTKLLDELLTNQLSEFEKEVLDLYLQGIPTKVIAQRLKREEKATDNALQRLKAKLRKVFI